MSQIITIDARMIGATGIGTYLYELLTGLALTDHEFRFRVLCANLESLPELPARKFTFARATAPVYSLREQWEIARLARSGDLLHCPHYNIPCLFSGRMVVTIHDLTHLSFREFLPRRLAYCYAHFMLNAAAHRARQVITVSQFSKKSICDRLRVREERVKVILYGPPRRLMTGEPTPDSVLSRLGIAEPYILFVGHLKPHKNVGALLRAYALLPEPLRHLHRLVIAGGYDVCHRDLLRLSDELLLKDRVIFTGRVSERELCVLYRRAKIFALPSLNEGYGLPVLEAMAYGVPVVVANTSSLPEVAGDAGMFVNPEDDHSIADALERLLKDAELCRRLSERGRRRANSISTAEFVSQHLETYREALQS